VTPLRRAYKDFEAKLLATFAEGEALGFLEVGPGEWAHDDPTYRLIDPLEYERQQERRKRELDKMRKRDEKGERRRALEAGRGVTS